MAQSEGRSGRRRRRDVGLLSLLTPALHTPPPDRPHDAASKQSLQLTPPELSSTAIPASPAHEVSTNAQRPTLQSLPDETNPPTPPSSSRLSHPSSHLGPTHLSNSALPALPAPSQRGIRCDKSRDREKRSQHLLSPPRGCVACMSGSGRERVLLLFCFLLASLRFLPAGCERS